jgi:hypothetical protein
VSPIQRKARQRREENASDPQERAKTLFVGDSEVWHVTSGYGHSNAGVQGDTDERKFQKLAVAGERVLLQEAHRREKQELLPKAMRWAIPYDPYLYAHLG